MHFVLKVLEKQFVESIQILEKIRLENPRELKMEELYYLLRAMRMEVHQLLRDHER